MKEIIILVAIIISLYVLMPNSDASIFDSEIIQIDPDFFSENNFKRYLIFGNQKNDLIQNSSIYGIQSDKGFFTVSVLSQKSAQLLSAQGYYIIEDSRLDFHSEILDASRIGKITGSEQAKINYSSTGNGTIIAVVDTGVDFSNPDIQHSLARDKANYPIMLDADGQGLVLTGTTFLAKIDKYDMVRNQILPLPKNVTSSVYVNEDGVFLDMLRGNGTNITIYNSFFPQIGNSITFNATINHDLKIGNSNKDYIKSKSGIYHLGVIFQGSMEKLQVIPVLVVDSNFSGVYDTVIPDLSTSWTDYVRFDDLYNTNLDDSEYDFDFTDESPIVLGSGEEFLLYDYDDDEINDYSAGTLGAQVLDIYGVMNNSTRINSLDPLDSVLLPGLDKSGNFFGLMTDFMGHGTASTASIVSSGKQMYHIYNNTKTYSITGVAPDAKIIPVKALWLGDTIYGWLWAAGFDNKNNWEFSGKPRVDIISNSWGISNFPTSKTSPGMDILSLILSMLVTPHSISDDYPGVTIVSSAGNSGHGYGTIGLPNVSPYGITVGATTNNVFVGYGPFSGQPRFGNYTTHYNEIVDFSSRGPGIIGDPKPDLMSIGAYGFTPSSVLKLERDSKEESFSLFGGTSMAAPLVSGSAAILIEELQKQSQNYDPFLIKNILMSTATDLNNDAFTQGAGLSNVLSALDYVNGNNGKFLVTNDSSYQNIKKILDPAITNTNSTIFGFEKFKLSPKSYSMTSWFAGQLFTGDRSSTTWSITNPSNKPLPISILPQKLIMSHQNQFSGVTSIIPDDTADKDNVFLPNFLNLSDVISHDSLSDYYSDTSPIPKQSTLMVLNVNFLFSEFMNKTASTYADDIKISSLYIYDWIDDNKDLEINSDELSLVNRAGSWGTVQELRVSDPNEKFDGTPLVGIYPVPTRFSYWQGNTNLNSTSMDYTVIASYYSKESWPLVWSESTDVIVPPKQTITTDVTLVIPDDLQPGVYQGFIQFKGESHTVNAPVSFVVKSKVIPNIPIVINGTTTTDVLYGNAYTKGAFDMSSRYMAGDWRQYYFDVEDDTINSAAIEISWENKDTNLSVFAMNPNGKIISTNVPSGVFGHFLEWPSLDWLGNSLFSQGGGFFPVKNKDNTSTVLYIPINQTGTYTLLTHTTLFAGNNITEPISLIAKFTDIYSETIPETIPAIMDIIPSETDKIVISDDSLSLGIIVGLIFGILIGVICILILKANSPTVKQDL